MQCKSCGAQSAPEATQCEYCGVAFDKPEAAAPPAKKDDGGCGCLLLFLVLAAILGYVLYRVVF